MTDNIKEQEKWWASREEYLWKLLQDIVNAYGTSSVKLQEAIDRARPAKQRVDPYVQVREDAGKTRSGDPSRCIVPGCEVDVTHDVPDHLCEDHWFEWFLDASAPHLTSEEYERQLGYDKASLEEFGQQPEEKEKESEEEKLS